MSSRSRSLPALRGTNLRRPGGARNESHFPTCAGGRGGFSCNPRRIGETESRTRGKEPNEINGRGVAHANLAVFICISPGEPERPPRNRGPLSLSRSETPLFRSLVFLASIPGRFWRQFPVRWLWKPPVWGASGVCSRESSVAAITLPSGFCLRLRGVFCEHHP